MSIGLPRRVLRRGIALALGQRSHIEVWWTPGLPVVYVDNPKSGCSTIKHSLKLAQAAQYAADGRTTFTQLEDPHAADDCLTWHGFEALHRGDARLVMSCARNPYVRALSGYLDKALHGDIGLYPEFRGERPGSFEGFLVALAAYPPRRIDPHFRPQWVNLGLPRVKYDALFYLENMSALGTVLAAHLGSFHLRSSNVHGRGALAKLRDHYTPRATKLVRQIYADDFARLGYSLDIARASEAPGAFRTSGGIVGPGAEAHVRPGDGMRSLRRLIRHRRLLEAGII